MDDAVLVEPRESVERERCHLQLLLVPQRLLLDRARQRAGHLGHDESKRLIRAVHPAYVVHGEDVGVRSIQQAKHHDLAQDARVHATRCPLVITLLIVVTSLVAVLIPEELGGPLGAIVVICGAHGAVRPVTERLRAVVRARRQAGAFLFSRHCRCRAIARKTRATAGGCLLSRWRSNSSRNK